MAFASVSLRLGCENLDIGRCTLFTGWVSQKTLQCRLPSTGRKGEKHGRSHVYQTHTAVEESHACSLCTHLLGNFLTSTRYVNQVNPTSSCDTKSTMLLSFLRLSFPVEGSLKDKSHQYFYDAYTDLRLIVWWLRQCEHHCEPI